MKRKLIVFNVGLIILSAFLAQLLKGQWVEFKDTHQLQKLYPRTTAEKSSVAKSAPASNGSNDYFAIVNNDLFTMDRTNLIPPEPPPPPPPKKELPPKPILSGIFRLGGDESVLMISNDPKSKGTQKRLFVGEAMDAYTLRKILDQRVVMQTDSGEEVEIRLNEPSGIVPKEYYAERTPSRESGGSKGVAIIGSASPHGAAASQSPQAASVTPTRPREPDVPAGTIVNGKRKVVTRTPFGNMESWEDVK